MNITSSTQRGILPGHYSLSRPDDHSLVPKTCSPASSIQERNGILCLLGSRHKACHSSNHSWAWSTVGELTCLSGPARKLGEEVLNHLRRQKIKTFKKRLLSSQKLTGLEFCNQGGYGLFHPPVLFLSIFNFLKPSKLQSEIYTMNYYLIPSSSDQLRKKSFQRCSSIFTGEVYSLATAWKKESEGQLKKHKSSTSQHYWSDWKLRWCQLHLSYQIKEKPSTST